MSSSVLAIACTRTVRPGISSREPFAALLNLTRVVRLDGAEVEDVAFEGGGRVVEMVGIPNDRVAEPEEDHRRDLRVVAQHVAEEGVDLRRRKALVVLKAWNDQRAETMRQQDLIGRDAQGDGIEIIDLRSHFDEPRRFRAEHAHALGAEMEPELIEIAMVRGRIGDGKVDRAGIHAPGRDQRGQQRVAQRR